MTCNAQKYLWARGVGGVEFCLLSLKGWHLHINWPLCFSHCKPRSLYLMCCHVNERCLRGASREFTRIYCGWLRKVGQQPRFLMRLVYEWTHMQVLAVVIQNPFFKKNKFWSQQVHFLLIFHPDWVFGHLILVFSFKILPFLDPTGEISCWMEVFRTAWHYLQQTLHM